MPMAVACFLILQRSCLSILIEKEGKKGEIDSKINHIITYVVINGRCIGLKICTGFIKKFIIFI